MTSPVPTMKNADRPVSGGREGEHPSDAIPSSEASLALHCDGLDPAKHLFHTLTLPLADRVIVAGHHGSKTSSRTALLDAVGASIYIVSSGPLKYSGVRLPDDEVIQELTKRGQVFRTDQDDAACATNAAKIGPDHDGRAGGCDNIRLTISDAAPLQVTYWHGHD